MARGRGCESRGRPDGRHARAGPAPPLPAATNLNRPCFLAARPPTTPGSGHLEAARCLLELGAAPNAQNVDGSTPLHMACACEHLELAKLLCAHGADAGVRDADGQTPAELAPAAMAEALLHQLK